MSGKPTYPAWIPDNSTNIVVPPGGQVTAGWLPLQKPPSQYFNWFFNLVSQWINFTGPGAPTVVVGSASYCSHASLAAALADGGLGDNQVVLITVNDNSGTTINVSKNGWRIYCLPGVSFNAGGGGSGGLNVSGHNVWLYGLRFSGFTTAVTFTVAAQYGQVLFNSFGTCTTEVDTSAVTGGKIPVTLGNITE